MGKQISLEALPLYAQVKAQLVGRIEAGDWKPGQSIPNEFALAGELGVSQGTVRKALGEMTADKLLVRRQGRGTFVAELTPEAMMFRYFNFYDEEGKHIAPDTLWVRAKSAQANGVECRHLGLERGCRVVRINRVRNHNEKRFIYEQIVVSEELFPGLAEEAEIPNTLYDHFQRVYGVTITGGDERLDAVLARPREARLLDVEAGSPLLRLNRLAYSFDQRPIEWRVSLCSTEGAQYLVRLK
ncbi:MAG: GntR family transcriptional regulator [Alphaproteobacteria bacterium]|nr:GntR family transcriptional regulator [Alphaproteobacteria bacterium]